MSHSNVKFKIHRKWKISTISMFYFEGLKFIVVFPFIQIKYWKKEKIICSTLKLTFAEHFMTRKMQWPSLSSISQLILFKVIYSKVKVVRSKLADYVSGSEWFHGNKWNSTIQYVCEWQKVIYQRTISYHLHIYFKTDRIRKWLFHM